MPNKIALIGRPQYKKSMQRCVVGVLSLWVAIVVVIGRDADAQGFRRVSVDVQGEARQYLLYAPVQTSSSDLRPLIFLLHGGGGSAQQIAAGPGKAMLALAKRDRVFLVVPDALGKMWDFGTDTVSRRMGRPTDDHAFFGVLLDELPEAYQVDHHRIFATGISRGGQASYYMACEFPGRLRAIAPVAMPMPQFVEAACRNSPPLGLALFHGTADPLVPDEGGSIEVLGKHRGVVLSTEATLAFWRQRNGCTEAPDQRSRIDDAEDDLYIDLRLWNSCSGARVALYHIVGGGHTWPSVSNHLPVALVGRTSYDINATDEIWRFFGLDR